MGVGNKQNGDDAIGPYVATELQKHTSPMIKAIDCGILPENYTSIIKQMNPETIVVVDAVDMGLPPGEIRRIPQNKLGSISISTHGMPLSVLIKYLQKVTSTIIFIGEVDRSYHIIR